MRSNIYPTGINITIPERNQEATLYPQELTSTLLIQMLFWVHGPCGSGVAQQPHLRGNKSLDCLHLQQFL